MAWRRSHSPAECSCDKEQSPSPTATRPSRLEADSPPLRSPEMTSALAITLTAAWRDLEPEPSGEATAGLLVHRNSEIINACCFKLIFLDNCFTAMDSWNTPCDQFHFLYTDSPVLTGYLYSPERRATGLISNPCLLRFNVRVLFSKILTSPQLLHNWTNPKEM